MNTPKTGWEYGTRDITRMHLTLTGYEAGRPLCDCDKEAELKAGAIFWHAVYAPKQAFTDPRLCPKCKQVWDESDPDKE